MLTTEHSTVEAAEGVTGDGNPRFDRGGVFVAFGDDSSEVPELFYALDHFFADVELTGFPGVGVIVAGEVEASLLNLAPAYVPRCVVDR
jgi:hypothetical protein